MSDKRELMAKPITELLSLAFGKGAQGAEAVEKYLEETPEGAKYPRRLTAFGAEGLLAQSALKVELVAKIQALPETSVPALVF